MEFLTPEQKKEKARRLFVGYGLLSVLIVLASYILISTALGYEVFRSDGEVVQNGLLFVDSHPDNADIFIDGKKESSGTNTKLSLKEGIYDLSLKKAGYNEWRDKVSLSGGTVKFVVYPRLLPKKPSVLIDVPFQNGQLNILQSPDKRWLAIASSDPSKPIDLYDQNTPNSPPVQFSLPAELVTQKKISSVSLQEWARDNRHVIARYVLDDVPLFVILDRENPTSIVDVTGTLAIGATDRIGFWDEKSDKIYIRHDSGVVQLADLKTRVIDANPITSDVVRDFYPISGSRAIYTVLANDTDLQVKMLTDAKSYVFMQTKLSAVPLSIKSSKFNRNEYTLISGGGLEKTYLYRNIESAVKKSGATKTSPYAILPMQPRFSDFSPLSRFVLATDGVSNTIYDIESKEVIRYANPVPSSISVGWFDPARLFAVDASGAVSIYDFDGANLYKLANSIVGTPYVNEDSSQASYVVPSSNLQTLRFLDIKSPTK